MVDVCAYLSANFLNRSAWCAICGSIGRILVCDDRHTRLCLITLICELIELCKVEVHVSTGCKTLGIVEACLIIRWVLADIIAGYYAVGSIDNLIVVVPYYLALVGRIWTVCIEKTVSRPVVAIC